MSKVIPGGAADKNGKLKPEDRIVSVGDGEEGEMVDVVDMKLGDVVKMIRGRAGTKVRLGVIPATGGEKRIYTITRAKIELVEAQTSLTRRRGSRRRLEPTSARRFRSSGTVDPVAAESGPSQPMIGVDCTVAGNAHST